MKHCRVSAFACVARVFAYAAVALGLGDGCAGLVPHPAFDLTSRALGQERAGSQSQRDCRERDESRNACEGADTAMLHGYVLQRREPASTTDRERERARLPLGSVAYVEMRLLWEYVLLQKRGHEIDSDIVCGDRGPVGAA